MHSVISVKNPVPVATHRVDSPRGVHRARARSALTGSRRSGRAGAGRAGYRTWRFGFLDVDVGIGDERPQIVRGVAGTTP